MLQRFLPLLFVATCFADQGDNPDALPSSPQDELKSFTLPDGFEIQLVADESIIQKPINLNFDAQGRLWVTGSELYPWPSATDAVGNPIPDFQKVYDEIAAAFGSKDNPPPPAPEGRDTVRILSDFDPQTGRARKVEIFADKLNIPSGVQPLPRTPGAKGDTAIVYSIPYIWRLEDTDGDGKAEKREIIHETFGFIDTHGGSSSYVYWNDGWIYGTHGFRNRSELKEHGDQRLVVHSGNTYRFKPDGSKFEIFAHGQTNPFGLTFDNLGNLYTSDSHSRPLYLLLRGAYYVGIGKFHDGLGFAPEITSDDHGSSAIAGIAVYEDNKWPEEFRGNFFNGNPVTRSINRAKPSWRGSTPRPQRVQDLLSSKDPWFRPVQVKLGPDGAIWVADFYNPIIGHYELPLNHPKRDRKHGRIWRIVAKGGQPLPANLAALTAKDMVAKLGDPNIEVRRLLTNELVERFSDEKEIITLLRKALRDENSALQRSQSLWTLARINPLTPEEQLESLKDNSPIVRTTALRISERYPHRETFALQGILDSDPTVRRISAEILVNGKAESMTALLNLIPKTQADDAQTHHTIRMALRNNLVANGGFKAAASLIGNAAHAETLADVSLGARTQEAATFLLDHLQRTNMRAPRAGEYFKHVAFYIGAGQMSKIGDMLSQFPNDLPMIQRLAVADGLNEASRKRGLKLPDSAGAFIENAMIAALASDNEEILRRAIEAVRESRLATKLQPLAALVDQTRWSSEMRASALEAIANLPESQATVIKALGIVNSPQLCKRAAELLGKSNAAEARAALATALPKASATLAAAISASLASSDEGATQLLDLVDKGLASPTLLRINAVAAPLGARPQALRDKVESLTKELPPENSRLDELITKRAGEYQRTADSGTPLLDRANGEAIFKTQCSACHRIQSTGGNVGPNLDGVASRGVHRLLEDILDPNRNVDPGFRQTIIETTDNDSVVGVNARAEGQVILLNDATGKEVSVPKSKVRKQTQSPHSLMPPTFEQSLSPKDLNDLIAFLLLGK